MSNFIPFTREQKERAASVDLESFLASRGERLIKSGTEKRMASDNSITIRGNEWYDHSAQKGGNAIMFVQRYYHMNFPEAVQLLLGSEIAPAPPDRPEPKPFGLPEPNSDMRRVFAYLTQTRGIDGGVVSFFAKAGLLYEDAEHHNAVFVGKDEQGVARHAHVRSTSSYGEAFRINIEGSDPRYSFHHVGEGKSLFVFEAPIDMLSYIALNPQDWQRSSYVACCGVSIKPVLKMLELAPQIGIVSLCQDNDHAGEETAMRMFKEIREKGLKAIRQAPDYKDWNDELLYNHESYFDFAFC